MLLRFLTSFNEAYSPAFLGTKGIDILEGEGEFCRLPQTAFILNKRKIRSRSYLLAVDYLPYIPNILGLKETGYLTLLDFQDKDTFNKLPSKLIIIALHPIALEFAQTLAQTGKDITLVIQENTFLKRFDSEAVQLILSTLKVAGVNLIIEDSVSQIRQIEDKKWLQVGNIAIETDEIILIHSFQPDLNGFNLEAMGIDIKDPELNDKRQTSQPFYL